MTERRVTRQGVHPRRAGVYREVNTDIVNENLRRDYERGCKWAGFTMVLVWGPLLVMHAMGCF